MKSLTRFGSISFFAALVLGLAFPAIAQGPPSIYPINLSGYEFRLGSPCTIGGSAGKCGVQFGGWTGGSGPVADGWTPFPGTRKGLWEAQVDYIGSADFGNTAYLQSGTFDLLFRHRPSISGTVVTGTVQWPSFGSDIGCGTNVAKVTVQLLINSGNHYFNGCLHDLPAGTVIPPKIWGTLQ
jgi:hypothetical protein